MCSSLRQRVETSDFESLYGRQFTLLTQLIKPHYPIRKGQECLFVISVRVVNQGFISHLEFLGQNSTIFSSYSDSSRFNLVELVDPRATSIIDFHPNSSVLMTVYDLI